MWAISTTNWNFPHFSPCETGGRKAREISICCRNCSQGRCSYIDFPLEQTKVSSLAIVERLLFQWKISERIVFLDNGLKSEFSSKFTDNNWLIIALKVSNEALRKGLCMPKYILQTWCGPGRALMLRLIHLKDISSWKSIACIGMYFKGISCCCQ